MRLVSIIKREEGFTLTETIIVTSILIIIIAMAATIYFQVNRHNQKAIEQSEFHQSFQLIKSLVERQVRFASEIAISNNQRELEREIFVNHDGQIIYSNQGNELVLNAGDSLKYKIEFKNETPFLETVLTANGISDEYELDFKLLILDGEIFETRGSTLYFSME